MNPRIRFSEYWDKLSQPDFTTIRSWNPEKERYYREQIGKQFTLLYTEKPYQYKNGKLICYAYLYSVEVKSPKEISAMELQRDTELNGEIRKDWFEKILKLKKVIVLRFTKRQFSIQKSLEVVE